MYSNLRSSSHKKRNHDTFIGNNALEIREAPAPTHEPSLFCQLTENQEVNTAGDDSVTFFSPWGPIFFLTIPTTVTPPTPPGDLPGMLLGMISDVEAYTSPCGDLSWDSMRRLWKLEKVDPGAASWRVQGVENIGRKYFKTKNLEIRYFFPDLGNFSKIENFSINFDYVFFKVL